MKGQWQDTFSNPVEVTNETSPGAALAGYLDHLRKNSDLVVRSRAELMDTDTARWCAPRACHGDIIRHIAEGNPVPDVWEIAPKVEPEEDMQASLDL